VGRARTVNLQGGVWYGNGEVWKAVEKRLLGENSPGNDSMIFCVLGYSHKSVYAVEQ